MAETMRLFIASEVSSPARDALEMIYRQREAISANIPERCKWVLPEQWHLTWFFLGNVAVSQLSTIQARLLEALATIKPVPAILQDIVYWPKPKHPKLIVCRLHPTEALLHIAKHIRNIFPEYRADKPFTPHITLARLKNATAPKHIDPPERWIFTPLPPAAWQLNSVTLYNSILTSAGPIHKPLQINTLERR